MKTANAMLMFSLLASSAATFADEAERWESCTTVPEQPITLCVSGSLPLTDPETVVWTVQTADQPRQPLKQPPATSLIQVADLKANADYLAVLSVGEGHPLLDIFALAPVLADQPAAPLFSLNPYPGTLNMASWHGQELLISSDYPFDQAPAAADTITEPTAELRHFLVNPQTGAVRLAGD